MALFKSQGGASDREIPRSAARELPVYRKGEHELQAESKNPDPHDPPGNTTSASAANAQKQSDESHTKAIERARAAIRKLAESLEHSVGEMMGSASTYSTELADHKSAIETGIPPHKQDDFGSVLLNQIATMQKANDGYRTELDNANRQIAKQKAELESLQELAFVDFLTKIPNRRSLEKRFDEESYRAKRYNQPLSLAFIDIDRFKDLNDTHGHHIGDRVLRGLAMKMQSSIRKSDFLARYGGEEFALLLPATKIRVANSVAEKLRKSLAQSIFRTDALEFQITVSIGVGELQPDLENFEEFFARVDAAMYQAKTNGRNNVVLANSVSA